MIDYRGVCRLAALGLLLVVGCGGGPGDVGPQTYEYAQALYNLANRKASDRIESVADQIEVDVASGAISENEAAWLNDVLDDARAGDWKPAMDGARRILKDQVKR